MIPMLQLMVCCTLIASLAACGGGGSSASMIGGPTLGDGGGGDDQGGDDDPDDDGGDGGTDPPDPPDPLNIVSASERNTYLNVMMPDFNAVRSAAVTGGQTPFATLPTVMGTTTYSGYLNLIMGNTDTSANVVGAADITVDFANANLSGTADGFMGVTLDANMTQQVVAYEGTVDMTGGTIGAGATGASAVAMSVNGTLDNGLNVFVVDGEMVGGFFGAGGEGLRARGTNTSIDGTMAATIDGAPTLFAIGELSATQN